MKEFLKYYSLTKDAKEKINKSVKWQTQIKYVCILFYILKLNRFLYGSVEYLVFYRMYLIMHQWSSSQSDRYIQTNINKLISMTWYQIPCTIYFIYLLHLSYHRSIVTMHTKYITNLLYYTITLLQKQMAMIAQCMQLELLNLQFKPNWKLIDKVHIVQKKSF